MSIKTRPTKGFCFGGKALDGTTIVYINVCGHEDIQGPVGYSGAAVDEDYIDKMGVENLQIPIAVGNPVEVKLNDYNNNNNKNSSAENKKKSGAGLVQEVSSSSDSDSQKTKTMKQNANTNNNNRILIVEVVVHKMLSDRCKGVWNTGGTPKAFDENVVPQRKVLIFRITKLALDWVQRETGIVVEPDSVRLVFTSAFQAPPNNQSQTKQTSSQNNKNPGESLPSSDEMMDFMKKMSERGAGAGAGLENLFPQNKKNSSSEQKTSSSPPPQQQNKQQEEEKSSSSSSQSLKDPPTSMIFSAVNNKNEKTSSSSSPSASPLIQEVRQNKTTSGGGGAKNQVMKKGFLSNTGGSLYGEKGSDEGVLPSGAGDPLGYMPKSLREKCNVVDARNMTQEQMAAAAAGAGNVKKTTNNSTSASAAPITTASAVSPNVSSSSLNSGTTEWKTKQTNNNAAAAAAAVQSPTEEKHQQDFQQKQQKEKQEKEEEKKTKIMIQEIDEDEDDEANKIETTTTSSKRTEQQQLSSDWKLFCASDWSVSNVKFENSSSSQQQETTTKQIVLSLNPANKFSVSDLDLEVVPGGVTGSCENDEKIYRCFSVGNMMMAEDDEAEDSSSCSCEGFSIKQWKELLKVEEENEENVEDNNNKFVLEPDNAKAKYKKATKELIITLPMSKC